MKFFGYPVAKLDPYLYPRPVGGMASNDRIFRWGGGIVTRRPLGLFQIRIFRLRVRGGSNTDI